MHVRNSQKGSQFPNPGLLTKSLAAEMHGAAKDAAEHILSANVAGAGAVGNGERQRADVIRNDTVRHVAAVNVLVPNLVSVWSGTGLPLYRLKDWGWKAVGQGECSVQTHDNGGSKNS